MASSARIDELRKKFEENPRRYFAPLANEFRKAGDIEQAIAICREYLPQQPGHMSGHIVYGQALYEARQFDESKAVFETALSLDPENLIALRHLGDIALIVGDSEAAKSWYRRVLEADPRNEEIQAQLASLDAASPSPTPVAELTEAVDVAALASSLLTPASVPTVEVSAVRPATTEPPAEAPGASAARAHLDPADTLTTEIVAESLSSSPTAEVKLNEAGHDVPPSADFGLDGLETTSWSDTPFARSEPSQVPPATIETDLGPAAPALATPEEQPASQAIPFLDLGEPAAAGAAEPPPAPPSVEPPPPAGAAEPTPAPPSVGPPAPAPDSGPFVTETMAELYLKQGHRDDALRVYRALLEQRPGDAGLKAKVADLEPRGGPTIREVLSVLALRRPGSRAEPSHGNGSTSVVESPPAPEAAPTPDVPSTTDVPRALDALPGQAADEAATTSAAPAPYESLAAVASASSPDAIAELFGNAPVSVRDESAAKALALSFANPDATGGEAADALQVRGEPAHPATSELSLDAVFSGKGQPAAAPSSFSFDQFFSRRATSPPPSTAPSATETTGSDAADDIADFTQWLEGLKQR